MPGNIGKTYIWKRVLGPAKHPFNQNPPCGAMHAVSLKGQAALLDQSRD